jgi:hypothetical protein
VCGDVAVTATAQEADRRAAYSSDVTYVTNSELGFDFLRDNLATVCTLAALAVAKAMLVLLYKRCIVSITSTRH